VLWLYLVGLAQLAAVAIGFEGLRHLTMPERESLHGIRLAVDAAAAHLDDPLAAAEELAHVRTLASITFYDAEDHVLATNVTPPLAPMPLSRRGRHEGPIPDLPDDHGPPPPGHGPPPPGHGPPPDHGPLGHVSRGLLGGHPDDRLGPLGPVPPGPPPRFAFPIEHAGRSGLYAVVQPASMPRLSFMVGSLIGVVLLVVGVASVLSARIVTRPLSRLSAAARAFGEGKLDARARLDRKDEIGDVSEAFDEMADRVARMRRNERELLANVSHEIRTPLARIRVALDLANEGDVEEARASLAEIGEDLAELERLVEDVLTSARLELAADSHGGAPPLRLEEVLPASLIERSVTRFSAMHPQHRLQVEVPQDAAPIIADPVLLRRAVDNLLDNAARYSDPASPIALRVRRAEGELGIEVADHGVGMSPEDLARVFAPFFRSDRSRARATGGLGLGLTLVRRIVEAHGGSIRLESTAGVGTTAHVRVPEHPPAPEGAAAWTQT
jgi:signal transduction histidine kinase